MSSEQKEIVMLVRRLVDSEIRPLAWEIDANGDDIFDWKLINILAKHNLIAPIIPREYGGRGLDYLTTSLVIEEIAAGCAGLAACLVGIIHAIIPIIVGGSEKQKETFLPKLVGPKAALMSFALTEPRGGSDLERLETLAVHQGSHYYINGVKDFIINGAVADYVTVCATTNPAYGRAGFQFFLVPACEIKESHIRNKMGLKYANTAQLVLQNSAVSIDNVIGGEGVGYLILTQTLDYGRALVGAIEVGIARSAYELALLYAHERYQFDQPIFSHQGVSFPLVDMATMIEAARVMVWKACWLMDQNEDYSKESSMAKVFASEMAQSVTTKAIDLVGATGYTNQNMLNVYFRDAKAGSLVEGTNNIQKLIIAPLL